KFNLIAGSGYAHIRDCDTCVYAEDGAIGASTTQNQYSGCTFNEIPNGAADPAYID
ncbi:unnamed protein product, partial [marine sediment metagenome]